MLIAPILFAAALLPAQLPTNDLPPKPKADTVLATVNGKPITAADVEPYLWDWTRGQVVQDLVSYQLIADDAAKHHVAVTEAEIEKPLAEQLLRAKESVPAGQDVDAMLHDRGMPRSRMVLRIKADLLLTKLANLEFKASDYVKTSTFAIVPASSSTADQQAAGKKADEAYQRLQKGEAWAKVLKSYTTDEQVLKGNGALDWVPISAFPLSTRTEIPALKVGQVTKPVQTRNGLQIFRIDELGDSASGVTLETLRQRALPTLRKAAFDRIMKEGKVEKPSQAHG